jgi:hypothetical protein
MVRRPLDKASVLKIDNDCAISCDWLSDWIRIVVIPTCRAYALTVLSVAVGPSQHKGFHAYVEISPSVRPELANRLQFLLGDDCHRVSLNRARMGAGLNEWNKLFEEVGTRYRAIYSRVTTRQLRENSIRLSDNDGPRKDDREGKE